MLNMKDKPKSTGKRGRPATGRKKTYPLQARLTKQLFDALTRLCERTKRKKQAEVVLALEAHLSAEGLWPPPEGVE